MNPCATDTVEIASATSEQFPFRGRRAMVAHRINDALKLLDKMILSEVRRCLGSHNPDVDDVAQEVRLHLAMVSLPAFDSQRDSKVSTFCQDCIRRFLLNDAKRRQRSDTSNSQIPDNHAAPDRSLDKRIEALAADVFANPENYFNAVDARIVRAMHDHPHMTRKELAAHLGYAFQSNLSGRLKGIRAKLATLTIEI